MPKINHIALYCLDIEKIKAFYCTYFGAKANELYQNKIKGFSSYFLEFTDGARLEIMTKTIVTDSYKTKENLGFTHLAIDVGSKEEVDKLTNTLRTAGIKILGEPRTTGDGYYESLIEDPEGNRIEITC